MTSEPATSGGETRSDRPPAAKPVRLLYPEYGPVSKLLGYGLLYVLVTLSTETLLVDLGESLPRWTPEPLGTALAVVLWALLLLTVLGIYNTQTDANPRKFASERERDEFLTWNRTTRNGWVLSAGLTVAGIVLVVLSWSRFAAALEELLAGLTNVEALGGLTALEGAWFVGFFVGYGMVVRGLDRLVVNLVREAQLRRYVEDPEALERADDPGTGPGAGAEGSPEGSRPSGESDREFRR